MQKLYFYIALLVMVACPTSETGLNPWTRAISFHHVPGSFLTDVWTDLTDSGLVYYKILICSPLVTFKQKSIEDNSTFNSTILLAFFFLSVEVTDLALTK